MTGFLNNSQEEMRDRAIYNTSGKQSFESANFRQFPQQEMNDALKGMKSPLLENDLMQRFPTQTRTGLKPLRRILRGLLLPDNTITEDALQQFLRTHN